MNLYKRGLGVGGNVVVSSGEDSKEDFGVGTAVTIGVVGVLLIAAMSSRRKGGRSYGRPLRHHPRKVVNIGGSHHGFGGDLRALVTKAEYGL